MTKRLFCDRCGREHRTGGSWCASCHSVILHDLDNRPGPGQDQSDEPIPQVTSGRPLFPSPPGKGRKIVCAGCGEKQRLCGHILGRPYCERCLTPAPGPGPGRPPPLEDCGPWQENAIRALEDASEGTPP
jgi:hypothetical protein